MGNSLNFLTIQFTFEAAQTLIDRHQLNQRCPRINQILERATYLTKHVGDLRHQTERNRTGNNRWKQQEQAENVINL